MGKGREWDCLFILGWEIGFELNFWWEREAIGNHLQISTLRWELLHLQMGNMRNVELWGWGS